MKARLGLLFFFVWKLLFSFVFVLRHGTAVSSGWSWTHSSKPVWGSQILGLQTRSVMLGCSVVFFHSLNLSQIHEVTKIWQTQLWIWVTIVSKGIVVYTKAQLHNSFLASLTKHIFALKSLHRKIVFPSTLQIIEPCRSYSSILQSPETRTQETPNAIWSVHDLLRKEHPILSEDCEFIGILSPTLQKHLLLGRKRRIEWIEQWMRVQRNSLVK